MPFFLSSRFRILDTSSNDAGIPQYNDMLAVQKKRIGLMSNPYSRKHIRSNVALWHTIITSGSLATEVNNSLNSVRPLGVVRSIIDTSVSVSHM